MSNGNGSNRRVLLLSCLFWELIGSKSMFTIWAITAPVVITIKNVTYIYLLASMH